MRLILNVDEGRIARASCYKSSLYNTVPIFFCRLQLMNYALRSSNRSSILLSIKLCTMDRPIDIIDEICSCCKSCLCHATQRRYIFSRLKSMIYAIRTSILLSIKPCARRIERFYRGSDRGVLNEL